MNQFCLSGFPDCEALRAETQREAPGAALSRLCPFSPHLPCTRRANFPQVGTGHSCAGLSSGFHPPAHHGDILLNDQRHLKIKENRCNC